MQIEISSNMFGKALPFLSYRYINIHHVLDLIAYSYKIKDPQNS